MFFVALTPTLSQRERVPFGAILQSPLSLTEGQGEAHSCYDSARSMDFEKLSTYPPIDGGLQWGEK
jgi:hypothetical protein